MFGIGLSNELNLSNDDTIKNAVLREPEVVEAGVRVSLQGDGIVMVQVQARLRTGTTVSVASRVVAPS